MKKILFTMIMTLLSVFSINAAVLNEAEDVKVTTVNVSVPSKIRIYNGDEFEIGIRTCDKNLEKYIKYEINDSTLNIWIDNISPDDLWKMKSEDIRISIIVPNEVNVKTNNSLLIASSNNKKKTTANYEKQ